MRSIRATAVGAIERIGGGGFGETDKVWILYRREDRAFSVVTAPDSRYVMLPMRPSVQTIPGYGSELLAGVVGQHCRNSPDPRWVKHNGLRISQPDTLKRCFELATQQRVRYVARVTPKFLPSGLRAMLPRSAILALARTLPATV